MRSDSTLKAIIQVRGSRITYGSLKFKPLIDSGYHSIDVKGFKIRRDGESYRFEDLPLSRALPAAARHNILRQTFELDDGKRQSYLEIDFELPEHDETARILFRASENPASLDSVIFEVEDTGGNWLPIDEVTLAELLPDSFPKLMEMDILSRVDAHNLDYLPMEAA